MKADIQYRKDYKPSDFIIDSVSLTFDLESENTTVTNVMKIRRAKGVSSEVPLLLDGEGLTCVSAYLNGHTYEPEQLEAGLKVETNLASFEFTVVTRLNPKGNKTLSGLFQSSDVFCTQCEAEGFRRITYYLDRPDVMTLFTTKMIADKSHNPVLLSNGNLIEKGDLDHGRHFAVWEDPHKKPCYLFALVAGDLEVLEDEFITRSGQKVDLHIYVKAHIDQCHHAMTALKHAMKWDEEKYDREYDLNIFNIVAVDDFNMGAMENKSLNIFNTKFILAHTRMATDTDFQNVLDVVGHEYFHNWTGNRITCRDWFQLSLKEGLTVFRDQEFTADFYSRPIKRIEDVNVIRSAQFAEDASPMAHPIRPDSYIEMNNFYTVTVYNKGSEIIRMQQTILGEMGFKKGMDLYFKRHDGQAVTCEDFIASMEDANKVDLSQFRNWYSQDGTPIVEVTGSFDPDAKTYTLTMSQNCPDSVNQKNKKPFHIPIKVGLLDQDGHEITEQLLHLTQQEQVFVFDHIDYTPVPSLLRDFSAPVKLRYHYSDEELLFLASHDNNAFNRYDAMQHLFGKAILSHETDFALHIDAARKTLYSGLDEALIAEALTLPSEKSLAEQMLEINVDRIQIHREKLIWQLANDLEQDWLKVYQHNTVPFSLEADSMAKRRLKNRALMYLAATQKPEHLKVAYHQFESAQNMTDQSAAFMAILNYGEDALRQTVIQSFYEQFKCEPLTLNKWFEYQACSAHVSTCEAVASLLEHPDFTFENPNRVYALMLRFAANQSQFHRADGMGYDLMLNALIKLNPINPQVAARLSKSLMNYQHYDVDRQQKMRATLEALMKEDLCKDVFEIVSKALDQSS